MKEKNKYSFLKANIVFLWEIMPSVWSVFSQNNMALTIFAICITGSVIGIIVCTSRYVMQKRKYSRSLTKRKRRLIQEAESDETKKIDLAIENERETDKYRSSEYILYLQTDQSALLVGRRSTAYADLHASSLLRAC